MKLRITILSLSIIFMFSLILRSKNKKESLLLKKGISFYNKKNFNNAIKKFIKIIEINSNNLTAKKYIEYTYDNYYNSILLFLDGMDSFIDKDYIIAKKKFKQSLMLNPFNKKAKFYLRLCYTPLITIKTSPKKFIINHKNKFLININLKNTIPEWIKKWEFIIKNKNNKTIKKLKGEKLPPKEIIWQIPNAKNLSKVKYYIILTSIYNREIKSKPHYINIVKN